MNKNLYDNYNSYNDEKNKIVKQFEVWWADIPKFAHKGEDSHIQYGKRPVIIISGKSNNAHSPVCSIVMVTKQNKRNLPCHIRLEKNYEKYGLTMPSTIMGESAMGIDKKWLKYKMGEILEEDMREKIFEAMTAHYERMVS